MDYIRDVPKLIPKRNSVELLTFSIDNRYVKVNMLMLIRNIDENMLFSIFNNVDSVVFRSKNPNFVNFPRVHFLFLQEHVRNFILTFEIFKSLERTLGSYSPNIP